MAKTPSKPVKAKADAQAAKKKAAKKPAAGARKAGVDPQSEETYRKNKEAIDKVLELCTGHLKQLGKPELAMEASAGSGTTTSSTASRAGPAG